MGGSDSRAQKASDSRLSATHEFRQISTFSASRGAIEPQLFEKISGVSLNRVASGLGLNEVSLH